MNFGRFANATLADSFPARVKLLILELGLKSLACERGVLSVFIDISRFPFSSALSLIEVSFCLFNKERQYRFHSVS